MVSGRLLADIVAQVAQHIPALNTECSHEKGKLALERQRTRALFAMLCLAGNCAVCSAQARGLCKAMERASHLYCLSCTCGRVGHVGLQLPPRHVSYHIIPDGLLAAKNCPIASAMRTPSIAMRVQWPV